MDQLERNLLADKLIRKITRRVEPIKSISRHSNMFLFVKVILVVFGCMQLMVFLRLTVKRSTRTSSLNSISALPSLTSDTGKYVNSTNSSSTLPTRVSKDISTDPVPKLTSCPALASMSKLKASRPMDLKTEVAQSELDESVFQSQQGKAREAVAFGNARLVAGGLHRNLTKNTNLSSIQEALGATASQVQCGNYTYTSGGHWRPADCLPRSKIAIIIPFRNRHYQLMIFLRYMIPFLQKQRLEFAIYVVNQENNFLFNKGILMNAGFLESPKFAKWDCIIFHDVDHIPQHEGNPYGCVDLPRHMMGGADNRNYRPPYSSIFGGVTAFNRDQFTRVNGFSNMYWGWCCEDDDMGWRVATSGLKRTRYKGPIAYYKVITANHTRASHTHEGKNRVYLKKRSRARIKKDGFSSVKYHIAHLEFLTLYTNISISFENTE